MFQIYLLKLLEHFLTIYIRQVVCIDLRVFVYKLHTLNESGKNAAS